MRTRAAVERPELAPAGGDVSINLTWAQLTGADLRFSTLIAAKLCNASLAGADFTSARLNHADFRGADLTGATFKAADVDGARFEGAILNGAVLVEAGNLTQEQIDSAHGNSGTLLPDGLTVPVSWLTGEGEAPARPEPVQDASRTSKLPDLYAILGLSPAATDRQIQNAYRAMAKALHPDRFPGDRSIEDAFKCASSAADILLDPRQRKLYDRRELDTHGNRLPECIAQEAKGRRHGVFAAAFLMGLMALPLTYIAVTWSQRLTPHEVADRVLKAPPDTQPEQLSNALEAEKALTRAGPEDAAPKTWPVAEKYPERTLDDGQPVPGGGGPAFAAENQVIPGGSAAPDVPGASEAGNTTAEPAPLPAGSASLDPFGPLSATPASPVTPAGGGSEAPVTPPAQAVSAVESGPARPDEPAITTNLANLQPLPQNGPEAPAMVPDDKETPSATAAAQPHSEPSFTDEEALMKKGTYLMRGGNVSAARLCFLELAKRGSARAAFAMGQSYDRVFLEALGIAGGVEPDAAKAQEWYDKAARLGARSGERGLETVRRKPSVTGSLPQAQPVN